MAAKWFKKGKTFADEAAQNSQEDHESYSHKIDHTLVSTGASDKKKSNSKLPKLSRKQYAIAGIVLVFLIGGVVAYIKTRPEPKPVAVFPENPYDELGYRQYLINSDGYNVSYADYLILGNEYLAKNDYTNAEKQFKQAESMDEDNFDIQYALAKVYRLQKNKRASLKYYDKVITKAVDSNSQYHVNLETLKAEQNAVASGDFELKQVEYPSEIPL